MKRLDQLTFTRFLAAMAVVFFHSGNVWPVNTFPFNPLLTSGQTAVSYFYVLSGFVLALAYFRRAAPFDVEAYTKARFSRIYPVYALSFLLTCLYYINIMATVKTGKVLANLFLLQAWNPVYALSFNIAAWSLSVEAFFYILFPLLVVLAARVPSRALTWFAVAFWAISQIAHSILYRAYFPDQHNLLLYFPPVHLNSFLLGFAGGVWYLSQRASRPEDQRLVRSLLLCAVFAVAAMLIARSLVPLITESFTLDVGLLSPFFLVIILCLAVDQSSLGARLNNPRLVLLGDASYALFILHVPVRWLGERWAASAGIPNQIFIVVYWIGVIALSILVYRLFERPARDWLRANFSAVGVMALDAIIILAAVYLGFAFQLGIGKALRPLADTLRFMARAALPAYLAAFILLRLYDELSNGRRFARLLRRSIMAVLLGSFLVAMLLALASRAGWVEGFSGTAILISAALTLILAVSVRWLIRALPNLHRG
ncbi:MAG TPA: acyltransferase [Anaerolineales bacterium]|jgi:peptidoglycan/LPS O-acetylase OafA/YrhL